MGFIELFVLNALFVDVMVVRPVLINGAFSGLNFWFFVRASVLGNQSS